MSPSITLTEKQIYPSYPTLFLFSWIINIVYCYLCKQTSGYSFNLHISYLTWQHVEHIRTTFRHFELHTQLNTQIYVCKVLLLLLLVLFDIGYSRISLILASLHSLPVAFRIDFKILRTHFLTWLFSDSTFDVLWHCFTLFHFVLFSWRFKHVCFYCKALKIAI